LLSGKPVDGTLGIDGKFAVSYVLIEGESMKKSAPKESGLIRKIFGRRLASWEGEQQEVGIVTGVPVMGLDALASIGYGPEAALAVLAPAGVLGLAYFPFIIVAVIVTLGTLYLSYLQTIAAYPKSGGAYSVAKENLGALPGLWAAVALLLDYLLNVAVGISAGVGAVVSAVPALHAHTLTICLLVLLTLTLVNLRGIRESGLAFVFPVVIFIGCIGVSIVIGLIQALKSGGNPVPAVPPPPVSDGTATLGIWLLLATFANGCTAMTGVEAVSNSVPIFRKPRVANAQWTLTVIVGILMLFLLGVAYLCSIYHIGAMEQRQQGYQAVLAQLVAALAGQGVFYYISIISIFVVLTYSAQTSFAAFPRVCQFLAEDGFLPSAFAERGRRLVFSFGIIVLAVLSALILIAFGGVTEALIPLFAVGAFSAFFLSQAGMVGHWLRKRGRGFRTSLVFNSIGAGTTAVALVTIVIAKFVEGAWMVVIVIPPLVLLFYQINSHYKKISREVERAEKLQCMKLEPPLVIIPIDGWNRVSERAVRFGLLLSDNITAVHVSAENDDPDRLKKLWTEKVEKPAKEADLPVGRLEIISSPYRLIHQPILDFVAKMRKENPNRLIAVIIPELVEPHWYEYVLHTLHATWLRTLLFLQRDQRTVVINIPWYLRE
jgi:amino acid transporter